MGFELMLVKIFCVLSILSFCLSRFCIEIMKNLLMLMTSQDKIKLKQYAKSTFQAHCNTGHFTQELHLLHHMDKEMEKTVNLTLLNVWLFKNYDTHFMSAYLPSCRKQHTRMGERFNVLENNRNYKNIECRFEKKWYVTISFAN